MMSPDRKFLSARSSQSRLAVGHGQHQTDHWKEQPLMVGRPQNRCHGGGHDSLRSSARLRARLMPGAGRRPLESLLESLQCRSDVADCAT